MKNSESFQTFCCNLVTAVATGRVDEITLDPVECENLGMSISEFTILQNFLKNVKYQSHHVEDIKLAVSTATSAVGNAGKTTAKTIGNLGRAVSTGVRAGAAAMAGVKADPVTPNGISKTE